MPKTTSTGHAKKSELPSTLKKSSQKAQRTFAKAYDSAMDEYDDEERAHRVAYAALKHTHEKVGDRWQAKKQAGPSDSSSESGSSAADSETAGGVNARASKAHLYKQAQKLDIKGRSSMTKAELVDALDKESQRQSKKNS